MHPPPSSPARAGFTLIEVLVSLGLCALLASSTASAIAFATRAERFASLHGQASLLLPSLYAAQRLRPAALPAAPPPWRVDHTTEFLMLSDDLRQEWHLLSVNADGDEIPPFTFRILNDAP